jgi:hypothetical protein
MHHLPGVLDWRSGFNFNEGPELHSCGSINSLQESFLPHHLQFNTPSRFYFAVVRHTWGWTQSRLDLRNKTLFHHLFVARGASISGMRHGRARRLVPCWTPLWYWLRIPKALVGAPPRIGFMKASSDICTAHGVGGSLSNSAVMFGLAEITYAPVSMVTGRAYFPIRSSACTLSWPCLSDTLTTEIIAIFWIC